MNEYIVATIAFFAKYPGWHDFAQDDDTMKAIKWLVNHRYLEKNHFNQARFTGKTFIGQGGYSVHQST